MSKIYFDRKIEMMNLETFFQRPVASLFGLFVLIFISQIWGEIFMLYYRFFFGVPDTPETALKVGVIATIVLIIVAAILYYIIKK